MLNFIQLVYSLIDLLVYNENIFQVVIRIFWIG